MEREASLHPHLFRPAAGETTAGETTLAVKSVAPPSPPGLLPRLRGSTRCAISPQRRPPLGLRPRPFPSFQPAQGWQGHERTKNKPTSLMPQSEKKTHNQKKQNESSENPSLPPARGAFVVEPFRAALLSCPSAPPTAHCLLR